MSSPLAARRALAPGWGNLSGGRPTHRWRQRMETWYDEGCRPDFHQPDPPQEDHLQNGGTAFSLSFFWLTLKIATGSVYRQSAVSKKMNEPTRPDRDWPTAARFSYRRPPPSRPPIAALTSRCPMSIRPATDDEFLLELGLKWEEGWLGSGRAVAPAEKPTGAVLSALGEPNRSPSNAWGSPLLFLFLLLVSVFSGWGSCYYRFCHFNYRCCYVCAKWHSKWTFIHFVRSVYTIQPARTNPHRWLWLFRHQASGQPVFPQWPGKSLKVW